MKTKIANLALIMVIGVLSLTSCNSAKYEGTYAGTMPCADCSGIETEITVKDGKYDITRVYLGVDNQAQSTFTENGIYKWDSQRNVLTFDNDPEQQYMFRNNTLVALDQDGREVTGDLAHLYVLKKK